jgi:hypothetical protein
VDLAGESITTVRMDGRDLLVDPEALAALSAGDGDPGSTGAGSTDGTDRAVWALPGFDEFMLGYKDRALQIDPAHFEAVVPGGNGVFRATLVRGGRVIATWTRTAMSSRVVVDVHPLVRLSARERRRLESAWHPYSVFLGTPVEVRWPPS